MKLTAEDRAVLDGNVKLFRSPRNTKPLTDDECKNIRIDYSNKLGIEYIAKKYQRGIETIHKVIREESK